MAERAPSHSRGALKEDGAPLKSSSPVESHDVTAEQPLQPDASWMPLYRVKQKAMDFLQSFVRSPYQGEDDKRMFLQNISNVCRSASNTGLLQGLEVFFQNNNLAEQVKMLLEGEPRHCLHSPVRELAMRATAGLSPVGTVLESQRRSLLDVCISRVFWLPPDEEMRERNKYYLLSLDAMDVMLEAMVFNSPPSRVVEELQHILEMLLDLTNCESTAVQERAVERIRKLSCALANFSIRDAWPDELRATQIPILGQLLGRLLQFQFSKGKTRYSALRAFYYLCEFIFNERRTSQLTYRRHLGLPKTSLQWCHFVTAQIKALQSYLTPCEKTGIVLAAIKAMRDSRAFDHQAARNFLEVAMRSPELWLTDVPSTVRGIRECLEHTSPASDVQILYTLLAVLAHESPRELVSSMLTSVAPHDSTSLAMWDLMYSQNNIRSKFWTELQGRICSQEQQDCELFSPTVLYAVRVYKAMLNPIDTEILELLQENRMSPKLEFLSLLLAGLSTTLESPEKARRLQFLLPDVVDHLQHPDKAIRMKALRVFQNVVHHTERKEASSIALRLSEQLLPLFHDECSELKESSIHLFKHLVESVVGKDKRRMRKKAWSGLVPLLLCMNEQTQSVAQVSREALLAVADILKWEELKQPIQTQHLWEIAEHLLEKDRSRAEEYLQQSLPYLQEPQASVREAAVRFIGLAARDLWHRSREMLDDILSTFQALRTDPEPSIRSLAAQSILVLRVLSQRRRSRGTLRALFSRCHWARHRVSSHEDTGNLI